MSRLKVGKIQVEIKEVYGETKVYPVCSDAKVFSRIAGTKTLTKAVLREIQELGYDIELVVNPKYLEVIGGEHG
jgi:hypothetical protein